MGEQKITAKDMEKYLAQRYCDSYEWVFLTQVRSSTGSANRIADAMAFNMYGSTGYEIIGFEIKVSRSDWLSELKHMGKSDELMAYCDKWYLVVSDASIVQPGELPKNWGLLVLKDGKLKQTLKPVRTKTDPIPLHFMASILRRGKDETERVKKQYIPREQIEPEIEKARQLGYEQGQGYNGKQSERLLNELRQTVTDFEEASGIEITSWRGKEWNKAVGHYVKLAMELSVRQLDSHIAQMESAVRTIQTAIKEIKKIKPDFPGEKAE